MSALTVIGIDLVVLGLVIAYWEWRYKEYGWGRGWMRPTARTWAASHHGYSQGVDLGLQDMVWGTEEGDPTIPVKVVPKDWEFDLPLSGADSTEHDGEA